MVKSLQRFGNHKYGKKNRMDAAEKKIARTWLGSAGVPGGESVWWRSALGTFTVRAAFGKAAAEPPQSTMGWACIQPNTLRETPGGAGGALRARRLCGWGKKEILRRRRRSSG
jgi:hypothetical protein